MDDLRDSPPTPPPSSAGGAGRGFGGRALVLVILVGITLPALFLWHESHLARRELAQELEALRSERGGEGERDDGAEAPGELRREIERLRTPRAATLVRLATDRQPGEEVGTTVRLPAAPGPIVFALEPPPPAAGAYRLTLVRGDEVLWRGEAQEPAADGLLVVVVPSSLLEAGDYRLLTVPADDTGASSAAGSFGFRCLPAGPPTQP